MWSLYCGSNRKAPSTPTAVKMPTMWPAATNKVSYETFREKRAVVAELERSTVAKATQLERAMRDYDNLMANQVLQVESGAPSALMDIVRTPDRWKGRATKNLALYNVDLDELQLPDMHEGLCRVFCQPSTWSPAFASPGDFTIKMAAVYTNNGEVCFRIAVMCCCAWSIRDGTRVKPVLKRQYYTSYVERTQRELVKLTEALSFQFLGHFFAEKMPTHGARGIRKQRALDEYGEEVVQFLSFVMQITAIGFNRLVALKDPVSSNVRLRDFLGLALGFSEQPVVATSSCDARIEGQDGSYRPVLPSAWMDANPSTSSDTNCYRKSCAMKRSLCDRAHDNVNSFDPHMMSRNFNQPGPGKCVHYVDPRYWVDETPNDGSFTVEISSVSVIAGVAMFSISVLSFASGNLKVTTVGRRYSEFDELARALEEKVRSLHLRKLLPPKTFFRSLSVRYLERRAASLQHFLERMLHLSFQGILDEEVPLTAEPYVRRFLKLPAVEWIVVPWSKLSPPHKINREDFRTNLSLSPTAASEFSQCYNISPMRTMRHISSESTVPRYESLFVRRSDSM
uniref:PX domain-containing protein n=1 Tax=Hyaloperonospora arabidopsidis (strain Emoy2) TaxID=559515 RepID=M4BQL3_HYAAE